MSSSFEEKEECVAQRFQIILKTFLTLEPNVVINDVYIETTIGHLLGKCDKDYNRLIESDNLLEWIITYTNNVQTAENTNKQVYAFYLRVLAIIIDKNVHLEELFNSDVFTQIKESIASKPELQTTASVKLGVVRVYKALLKHKRGILWIKSSNSWKTILQYCIESQTVYVLRESQQFMSEFLFKVDKELNDSDFCLEILTVVCAPLLEISIKDNNIVGVDSFSRTISPSLQLVIQIILYVVRSREKSCIHDHIYYTRVKYKVILLMDMTRNQTIRKEIAYFMVVINLMHLLNGLLDDSIPNKSMIHQDFGLSFFNHTKICLVHRDIRALLYMASVYYNLWTELGDCAPEEIEIENNKYQFESQLIFILMAPILVTVGIQYKSKDEIFVTYISKIVDVSLDHTIRTCYLMRDIMNKDLSLLPDITKASIQELMAMKSTLKHDRAVYVFQALSHCLTPNEMDIDADTYADKLLETPTLLSAILNGMHTIMTEYRITWNESMETMSVLNNMLLFLAKSNLTAKLAVEALKLAQLSIEHFLPPNLALLINSLDGSPIQHLGSVVMKRLHDVNWEVRDSALELVHAMASIAVCKYPPFQEHIFQNNICQEAANLMKNDSEGFVRASALKSLQPMVGISLLWERCLMPMDLLGTVLLIIRNETEAIVRIEAVRLLCCIYKRHRIPQHQYDLLFSTMAYCATKDLHWEVKTSAIVFQKLVIQRQFEHYGALDGEFPSVTFSKEKKKIVTLTKKEISNRIDKILDDLSVRGCLGILLTSLHDECDLNVVKVSNRICQKILAAYKKYNDDNEEITSKYLDKMSTAPLEQSSQSSTSPLEDNEEMLHFNLNENGNSKKLLNDFKQNEKDIDLGEKPMNENPIDQINDILESIVFADDISLLAGAYRTNLNVDDTAEIDTEHFHSLTKIDRVQFIDHLYNFDFDKIVNEREEWMEKNESFSSVLEDMLFSLPVSDVNSMDCY